MPTGRICSWLVAAAGAVVGYQAHIWLNFEVSSGSTAGLIFWTFCGAIVLGGLLSVIWLGMKRSAWSKGNTILLAASGWAISAAGILTCYIAAELASLAVTHGIREAQRCLIFSIVSLDASVAIFVLCPGWLLYSALVRR